MNRLFIIITTICLISGLAYAGSPGQQSHETKWGVDRAGNRYMESDTTKSDCIGMACILADKGTNDCRMGAKNLSGYEINRAFASFSEPQNLFSNDNNNTYEAVSGVREASNPLNYRPSFQ